MANTRFFRSSQNLALTATLKNGSGGGAPSLAESSASPMSNAIQHDRYTPWMTNSTPAASPVNLDIDLGSTVSVYALGVHRYRLLAGTAGTLTIGTQTGAYNGAGAFTTFGTISSANLTSSKDRAVIDTSTVSTRSVRFSFAHTSAVWSVGKLWVVVAPTIDLGQIYAIGSVLTPVRYQVENVGPSGIPMVDDFNEDGFLWSLDLSVVTTATKTAVWTTVNSGRSCSMLDDNDKLEEVRVVGGAIPTARMMTDAYAPRLELARLP